MNQQTQPVLRVEELSVRVRGERPPKPIIEQVSFTLHQKEILAIVGGSGSGKSTTAFAILQLLSPALEIARGKIYFNKTDLLMLTSEHMQEIRGLDIGMVFQEPLYAFNPLFTVGHQIEEVLEAHTKIKGAKRKEKVLSLLDMAGIAEPRRVYSAYPHQLSGGMRQRAMIAQAISVNPKVIIADEPTSNLDVTLQARIMQLFDNLRKELDLGIVLISHDLGMVSHLADNILVMHQGSVVEKGPARDVTRSPKHEYTKQMMEAFA